MKQASEKAIKGLPWPVVIESWSPVSEYNGDLIVLLRIPSTEIDWDRNIWRIHIDGGIKWRIWGDSEDAYDFTGFYVKHGVITAFSASASAYFDVDPETGYVTFREKAPYLG